MSDAGVKSSRLETLQVWMECHLSEVRPVVLQVVEFLRNRGAEEGEQQVCELALVEACNNAVSYARPEMVCELILVEVLCGEKELELRVNDHTAGFELPKQVDLPAAEQECGRGLFLIQSLMDEVRYLRSSSGNCLVMRRRRAGSPLASTGAAVAQPEEVNHELVESEQIIREMAEELSFCYEGLSAIFRASAELGKRNNLEEFSQRLLTDLVQITSAEWFLLRVVAKEESALVVLTASEPALQLVPVRLTGAAGELTSAELEAAALGQDVWFDAQRPLENHDPLQVARPNSIGLIHPFYVGDHLVGTLTVGKSAGPHFTAVHANVVHTFSDFLAIQVVNARFQEEKLASHVVSRELEIARNIQRSLLPTKLPELPGCTLAGFCESARQVGGDFYDVLQLGESRLLLIVADVMGKGVPAAMFAAILRSLLRAVPEWTQDPAALLGRINRLLYEELSSVDMFITAQLVVVDLEEGSLMAASAGHCPALNLGKNGEVKLIAPEGLPLGILEDSHYMGQQERLEEGARLLLYTDGLTEARDLKGEFFGQERLVEWWQRNAHPCAGAIQLGSALVQTVRDFQQGGVMSDDQTFLVLAREEKGKGT